MKICLNPAVFKITEIHEELKDPKNKSIQKKVAVLNHHVELSDKNKLIPVPTKLHYQMHTGKSIWLQIQARVHQPHSLGLDEAAIIRSQKMQCSPNYPLQLHQNNHDTKITKVILNYLEAFRTIIKLYTFIYWSK